MNPVNIYHPTDRPNFTNVDVGPVELWFSYTTVIAFSAPGIGRVVSENVWSKTTGKHLNHIDDRKDRRVRHAVFEARLAEVMGVLAAGLGEHDFAPLSPDDYAEPPRQAARRQPSRTPCAACNQNERLSGLPYCAECLHAIPTPAHELSEGELPQGPPADPLDRPVSTSVGTTNPIQGTGDTEHRNTGGPPLGEVEVDDLTPDITARLAAIDNELNQGATMSDNFWDVIAAQLSELTSATTAQDVVRILSWARNPYGETTGPADGFFAGSGGDDTVSGALREAGWTAIWSQASYYYAMRAPDGTVITYIEGDIYVGDKERRPGR